MNITNMLRQMLLRKKKKEMHSEKEEEKEDEMKKTLKGKEKNKHEIRKTFKKERKRRRKIGVFFSRLMWINWPGSFSPPIDSIFLPWRTLRKWVELAARARRPPAEPLERFFAARKPAGSARPERPGAFVLACSASESINVPRTRMTQGRSLGRRGWGGVCVGMAGRYGTSSSCSQEEFPSSVFDDH